MLVLATSHASVSSVKVQWEILTMDRVDMLSVKIKLFWEKLWAIKNFFVRFKWKIFLNIHILTGLCDAKDTFFITSGGTFSRQI